MGQVHILFNNREISYEDHIWLSSIFQDMHLTQDGVKMNSQWESLEWLPSYFTCLERSSTDTGCHPVISIILAFFFLYSDGPARGWKA
jgi:hypothetical protein